MPLLENAFTTLPLFTTTTIKATGATTLVGSVGANLSVVILDINVNNQTNTTGYMEMTFREGAAGTLHYRMYSPSTGANVFQKSFQMEPWILDTNASFYAVMSVTAASSPAAEVTVMYRILDRTK